MVIMSAGKYSRSREAELDCRLPKIGMAGISHVTKTEFSMIEFSIASINAGSNDYVFQGMGVHYHPHLTTNRELPPN